MNDTNPLKPVILFVDDEPTAVKYFQRAIDSLAPVATAGSVDEGKRLLDTHAETLLVLVSDQRMPGAYGNELLEYAKNRYPNIVRILTTAYSELESTVEAVNQGQIHRYIQKPWEITALRMELNQALDLANLRKDHANLLREKMMIRHNQIIANRIGTLYALCVSVAGHDDSIPMESYLSAALTAGVMTPEPDWLLMDHSDLISAEAFRSGRFGNAVGAALADIQSRHPRTQDMPEQKLLEVLVESMDGQVESAGGGNVVFLDQRSFAEFLEMPTVMAVSPQHVRWLAFLLWLGSREYALQTTRSELGLQCKLVKAESHMSVSRLADWIEQF